MTGGGGAASRAAGFSAAFAVALLAAGPGLAADGARVYSLCKACHTLSADSGPMVGPSLHGVFGRPAGTLPGFPFSPALRHSGLVWDEATLDAFLADPRRAVPANRMAFPGIRRAEDRRALVDFLKRATR